MEKKTEFESDALLSEGFTADAPGQAYEIDREVAEEKCTECGNIKEFRPRLKQGWNGQRNYTYRAFSVCTHCGTEEEF